MLGNVFRFYTLCLVKSTNFWCYPTEANWIGEKPEKPWENVRLVLVLNHTSLFEFVYGTAMPVSYLWRLAKYLLFPVANESLDSLQGKVLKVITPKIAGLTRKRDDSWQDFCEQIDKDTMLIFMPEGRMKRTNGLDKQGNPMTVRTGVCDLLEKFRGERMILAYSGGLHHVLAPGQLLPRPFRKLKVNFESIDVDKFLASFSAISDDKARRIAICKELDERRDQHCPNL